jgi:hypothetical protein
LIAAAGLPLTAVRTLRLPDSGGVLQRCTSGCDGGIPGHPLSDDDVDPAEQGCGSAAAALGLIPVTVPELLKQLRSTVIPEPRRDKAHRDAWALWRRRHQYQAQQAHQRWHAYADEL